MRGVKGETWRMELPKLRRGGGFPEGGVRSAALNIADNLMKMKIAKSIWI